MRVDRPHLGVPREGHLAGDAAEQHAAQGVDVGASVHLVVADLLGRHVVDRPDELTRAGQSGSGVHPLGDAEVGEVRMIGRCAAIAGQQDVAGLDVAMDQALGVRGVQRRGRLRDDRDRTRRIQPGVGPQEALQVRSLDVPHRDVQHAVGLARVVDGDDVGMVETGGDARFADEPLPERFILGELGTEDLQRDPAPEAQVLGQVDDGHPSSPDHRCHPMTGDLGPHPAVGRHQWHATGSVGVSLNGGWSSADTQCQVNPAACSSISTMPNVVSCAAASPAGHGSDWSGSFFTPPVPMTNSRIPRAGSGRPAGSCGSHR